jgi:CheY-like chemotaxis protein
MKILIVDDEPRRYDRLVDALAEAGISRSCIDIVPSTFDARSRMEGTQYDLLLLDILIPFRVEEESDTQHSFDLLTEIQGGETLKRPRYILGITAEMEISKDVRAHFADWTWTVLEYSSSNDEWINRTVNCATFIKKDASRERASSIDIAILCSLAKPELEEVLRLPWHWTSARPIDDSIFIRDGYVECEGRRLTVCATSAPRMGMVSSALTAASLVSLLKPGLIVMCGICAGVRGKVHMGDVLFADPAWDFQSGKRVSDGKNTQFAMRPHQIPAPHMIRRHMEQIRDDRASLARLGADFDGEPPGLTRVMLGPVASGSAVLADGEVVKEVVGLPSPSAVREGSFPF